MKRHRHTPEQAVRKVREGERLLNDGKDLAEILRVLRREPGGPMVGREPQARQAVVARGRPTPPGSGPQTPPGHDRAGRAVAGQAPQSGLGDRLPVR